MFSILYRKNKKIIFSRLSQAHYVKMLTPNIYYIYSISTMNIDKIDKNGHRDGVCDVSSAKYPEKAPVCISN